MDGLLGGVCYKTAMNKKVSERKPSKSAAGSALTQKASSMASKYVRSNVRIVTKQYRKALKDLEKF